MNTNTINAKYACKCSDGQTRFIDGSTEEEVCSIVQRAEAVFGVTVDDLIDEIRNGSGENEEQETPIPISLPQLPLPVKTKPLVPWMDEVARSKQPHIQAIYTVACAGNTRKLVRGFLNEPLSQIARHAANLHHVHVLEVIDEIPLGGKYAKIRSANKTIVVNRKRGRPKGSKNKPKVYAVLAKEK